MLLLNDLVPSDIFAANKQPTYQWCLSLRRSIQTLVGKTWGILFYQTNMCQEARTHRAPPLLLFFSCAVFFETLCCLTSFRTSVWVLPILSLREVLLISDRIPLCVHLLPFLQIYETVCFYAFTHLFVVLFKDLKIGFPNKDFVISPIKKITLVIPRPACFSK